MDRVHDSGRTAEPDRRARKREALRQTISDAATRLFAERGFDAVTVDDVARAADVSRMTVFNHFSRKEDMFFDRAEETAAAFERAVAERPAQQAPLVAFVRLVHTLVASRDPVVEISSRSTEYTAAIAASPALTARAQVLRSELAVVLARSFQAATGRQVADPDARLAAEMLVAVWSASYATAQDVMRGRDDPAAAAAAFLESFDKGAAGVMSAFEGTTLALPGD